MLIVANVLRECGEYRTLQQIAIGRCRWTRKSLVPPFLFELCVVCFEVAIGDVFCLLTERWMLQRVTLVQTASPRASWPGQLLQMGLRRLVGRSLPRQVHSSISHAPCSLSSSYPTVPFSCPHVAATALNRITWADPHCFSDFPRRSPENGRKPGTSVRE